MAGARIVAVSSGAHAITGIRWDDIHFERCYDKWQAYGQSKCANVLFALELDRRGKSRGIAQEKLDLPAEIRTVTTDSTIASCR